MKKTLSFELIYRVVDVVTILAILFAGTLFYSGTYNLDGYLLAGLLAVLLFGLLGRFMEVYSSWGARPFFKDEAARVIITWLMTFMLLIFAAFISKTTAEFSRLTLITWLFATPIVLTLNRYGLRKLFAHLRHLGFNTRHVVIVGLTDHGLQFAEDLKNNPDGGFNVAGFYDHPTLAYQKIDALNGKKSHTQPKHLGDFDALVQAAEMGTWDQIYLALPIENKDQTVNLLEKLSKSITPIRLIPDYFTSHLLKSKYMELANTPILCIHETPLTAHNVVIKRIEDVVIASLILFMISPVMLTVALAVKLTSRGPVLFKQKRHGIRGETFTVYKFRSMTVCEDGDHIKQATRNDARVTKVGQFIRKTSLDELPQFINVLQGNMSIVGPRPHAISHNEHYRQLIPGYMLRHMIKPGITGWAQINGWRGETDTLFKMEKRVEHDLDYIRRWSLWLDIKIILVSIVRGFSSKNAY
ncbi:MAG: undecaprenyl-phosphate glucose phosphotransferase [bacterium]